MCAPVIARAWVSRAGPGAQVAVAPGGVAPASRMTSMPSTGAAPRNSTALAHPVSPQTTLEHQCIPYVKYT